MCACVVCCEYSCVRIRICNVCPYVLCVRMCVHVCYFECTCVYVCVVCVHTLGCQLV